ncbi:alpha/beta hydrolase [Aeromicrobium sp. CTD01-1L150]|uniref:alpha/beta hydrolase n=1 Tax=Aeromicrobium sp. CTD01-1L150 TaxID=3341830 RepID=UPI0035C00D56
MRWIGRLAVSGLVLVLAAALCLALFAWPSALLVRWLFTGGNAELAARVQPYVAGDVERTLDVEYTDGESLDVLRPAGLDGELPVVVWLHGGAWVGGDKSDVRPYLEVLASQGRAVVGVNYSRAPGHEYPTPVRQAEEALDWVEEHADEHGLDPSRLVLAGDSAGAQIAVQAAIEAPPGRLEGLLLQSGAFDPGWMVEELEGFSGRMVARAVSSYLEADDHDAARVVDHVTADLPPVWLTSGDADPLHAQSVALVQRLEELGIDVTAHLPRSRSGPPLGHEYQFDLALEDSVAALEGVRRFLDVVLSPGSEEPG